MPASEAEVYQGHVRQPVRQVRIDKQLVVRRVRLDAQHGLQQREARAGGPRLWHIGAEVLDWEVGAVARYTGVEFRQLVEQEVAGGAADIARDVTGLGAEAVSFETKC